MPDALILMEFYYLYELVGAKPKDGPWADVELYFYANGAL
jgi:hypothetical protein